MSDTELTRLLVNLADAIRDVAEGPEHKALVAQFFALIQHLEASNAIRRESWNLSSRS